MKTVSVVVPVYQNATNLPESVPRLLGLAASLPDYRLEIVLVDDGSTDGSREAVLQHARVHPGHVRAVLLTRNFGQTAAIQAGFRHASGACVAVISCDLQEPPELIVEMVRAWENGSRFVLGERVDRAENARRRFISGVYWFCVRKFAFSDFPSLGYDFCLLDRQVVDDVTRINEKNSSIFVLIYWLGYRPHRIPIYRELRRSGRSQWRLWKKVSFTVDTLIAFSHLPARLITFAGLTSAALCLIHLLVVVGQWYWLRAAPPGWATLAGLVLLLGAMILFSLGILSEYLFRILDETRQRPPFVVEQVSPLPGKSESDEW